ncbi:NADH-quinone oxidoreductase subunit J [Geothrix oryzisoli]|uniref:NADH-quinone oxidoreductase subunit J family protein n=1 Tax=Geothrix oryzisoli TaxID=2922721 RepID=UPI001FAC0C9D|nr:NADH-quinone oxidoreductase subunit J [Geothrix oryzisoli]
MEHFIETIGRNMFAIFGVMALVGGLLMIASKSAIHSVLGFLFAMLNIAGCFLALEAEFLGVAQILVYAGGIVVLFLFVVMLVEVSKKKEGEVFQLQSRYAVAAVAVGAAMFLAVFRKAFFGVASPEALVLRPELAKGLDVAHQNAQAVSRGLFADYLLPFEILSVILLVALVGAVVLAKTERV